MIENMELWHKLKFDCQLTIIMHIPIVFLCSLMSKPIKSNKAKKHRQYNPIKYWHIKIKFPMNHNKFNNQCRNNNTTIA